MLFSEKGKGEKKKKVSLCIPSQLEGACILILMAGICSLLALKCPGKCQRTLMPDEILNDPGNI